MPTKKKQRAIAPCNPIIRPLWHVLALGATKGTRFGAIIRCALHGAGLADEGNALQKFIGKAVITSDGYVQCNLISADGAMRHSAFVGDASDLERNTADLIQHIELTPEDTQAFLAAMAAWIATDYRS